MSSTCEGPPPIADLEPVVNDSTTSSVMPSGIAGPPPSSPVANDSTASSTTPGVIAEPPPPPPAVIAGPRPRPRPPPPKPQFRFFLNLPPEIRHIVYEQLFAGSYLELEERACSCSDSRHLPVYWSGRLPGVLTATKLIREEALPIFSACLTPITYDLFPSTAAAKPPAHYLAKCEVALIDEQSYGLLDAIQLPSLKELRVHLCWDPELLDETIEHDLDVTEKDVLDGIMKHYETKNVHYFLKDAKEKGTLTARAVIETQVEIACASCDVYGCWRNILIDIDKREIIGKIDKDALEHGPDCPEVEKPNSEDDADNEEDGAEQGAGESVVENGAQGNQTGNG